MKCNLKKLKSENPKHEFTIGDQATLVLNLWGSYGDLDKTDEYPVTIVDETPTRFRVLIEGHGHRRWVAKSALKERSVLMDS